MPFTMPRSTAQMTGCSMAASPNGQWLLTMRSSLPRCSVWAAKPWAVRASATACSAARNERCPSAPATPAAMARPYSMPTSSAIASASAGEQARQCPPEHGEDEIVGLHRHRQRDLLLVRPVALRRATGTAGLAALDGHVEVAAGGQLVEVVAGHVGVEPELARPPASR